MSEEGKKISFSFTKFAKKTVLQAVPQENNVQFIECVEGNSIKVVGNEPTEKKPLIIPMINDNSLRENMIAAVKSRNVEKLNGADKPVNEDVSAIEPPPPEEKPLTLDEMAAKEIMEDLKKNTKKEESKIYAVPLPQTSGEVKTESSLDDYENVPISEFGLAMLRGMGWQPAEGIGKNKKLIKPPSPQLRPKGMGLGADKVINKKPSANTEEGGELPITKGSCIKIIAGQHKNLYGKVEGLDDATGRLIVKLAIEGSVISIGEFMVVAVSKNDYSKNSNVINVAKYNEYKEVENSKNSNKKAKDANNVTKVKYPEEKNISITEKRKHSSSRSNSPKSRTETRKKKALSRSPSQETRREHQDKQAPSRSPNRKKYQDKQSPSSPHRKHKARTRDRSNSSSSPDRRKNYRNRKESPEYKAERSNKYVSSRSSEYKKDSKQHRSRSSSSSPSPEPRHHKSSKYESTSHKSKSKHSKEKKTKKYSSDSDDSKSSDSSTEYISKKKKSKHKSSKNENKNKKHKKKNKKKKHRSESR